MAKFSLRRFILVLCASVGLVLTSNSAFAQHGGGHGGGGGSHGGGGFHSGGGSYGGARSSGEGSSQRGGYGRESAGRSEGRSEEMGGRSYRGSETGRGSGLSGNHSSNVRASNVRAAINDGQWHSFGSSGNSARTSLSARNIGGEAGGWHSFGGTGFAGVGFHGYPGYGWRGGCCGFGWGGFGFGYGLGVWDSAWDGLIGAGVRGTTLTGMTLLLIWYPPLAYPDYDNYSWDDSAPPYRPDLSNDNDQNRDSATSSLNASPSDVVPPYRPPGS